MTTQSEKRRRIDAAVALLAGGWPPRIASARLMAQFRCSRSTSYSWLHEAETVLAADDDGPSSAETEVTPGEIASALAAEVAASIAAGDLATACKLVAALDKAKRWQAPGKLQGQF